MPQWHSFLSAGAVFYHLFLCLKTVLSGDSLACTEQRLRLTACHCTVSGWLFGGQVWQMSLAYHCGEAPRSQLGCQAGKPASAACALDSWVPACTASRGAHPPSLGLCFQVSLPACGASLDHCHPQYTLAVAYLTCLLKTSTAAAPVGAGPGGTQLRASGHAVKLWVYQSGTSSAERSRSMNNCNSNDVIDF